MNVRMKSTLLFIIGIIVAGILHIGERVSLNVIADIADKFPQAAYMPYLNSLGFCLNLIIYVCLLFYWITSLQMRLLPSRSKNYLISIALLMIFYLALRSAKYRFSEYDPEFAGILWYLYYIPIIFIPTLFLMNCISMKKTGRKIDERRCLIPAFLLTLMVLTNNLHNFVFGFPYTGYIFGSGGSYTHNAGYYIITVFLIIEFIIGMAILTDINRSFHSFKKVITPFLFLILMLGLLIVEGFLGRYGIPRPFNPPEIYIFCILGVLESCVGSRLIPYNDNYAGFYESMSLPAMITDRSFKRKYVPSVPVEASGDQLKASLEGPVHTDPDTALYGKEINAGYAFYTEDESELNRLNEQLSEANELLASKNSLIRAENELREKLARVESRNRIYSRISEMMYGKRKQLSELLKNAVPGSDGFRDDISLACVMMAYIKRGTNLILSDNISDAVPLYELYSALGESARYLSYCGITAAVADFEKGTVTRSEAFAAYTAFEEICEYLIGRSTLMTVAYSGDALRVTADCSAAPDLEISNAVLSVIESEGLYYFTVRTEKGAEG